MGMTNRHTGATGQASHHDLPATAATVHWGYLSRSLKPVLSVKSGDFVTIETLTHHAYDDHARMIAGDPGADLPDGLRVDAFIVPGGNPATGRGNAASATVAEARAQRLPKAQR